MKNRFLLIMAALIVTTSITGCNMMKGAGKDVENAGKSVQKTVEKND